MNELLTIPHNPTRLTSQDYQFLREEGLKYIEQLGHQIWTDYNIHDPGITILEALCYAIVDLGYRSNFDIKDLISEADGTPNSDFFTARDILPSCPLTPSDYRKLLIDLEGVKNAWLIKVEEGLQPNIFADCKADSLSYNETPHPIRIKGIYDILIELEENDAFGDLNENLLDFVIWEGDLFGAKFQVQLPHWPDVPRSWVAATNITNINLSRVELVKQIGQQIWEIDAEITYELEGGGTDIYSFGSRWGLLEAPEMVLDETAFGNALDIETSRWEVDAIFSQFQEKIKFILGIVDVIWAEVQHNRNLCEDFREICSVGTEEIGLCADFIVSEEADIEEILAQVYFLVEQYFQPSLRFYQLQELLDAGKTSDEIFNGPALDHGFIDDEELAQAQLKETIYASDIINIIMDIEGVVAVKNLLLTKYDEDGKPVPGASNVKWCMSISPAHRPSLSLDFSNILFFKGELPFRARTEEVLDTLAFIKSVNNSTKLKGHLKDLPIPSGTYADYADYTSVQHEFAPVFGLGYNGISATASPARKAQAKQLKAYLLFFDQILSNYLAQLAHFKDLFSFHSNTQQTYFAQYVADIKHVSELYTIGNSLQEVFQGPNPSEPVQTQAWRELIETEESFVDRRNRFLDHLLARFAEQFTDYAMLLYNLEGEQKGGEALIEDKMKFLQQYPTLSKARGKAFNYQMQKEEGNQLIPDVWDTENVSGYQKRLANLMGLEEMVRENSCRVEVEVYSPANSSDFKFRLRDSLLNVVVLTGTQNYSTEEEAQSEGEIALDLGSSPNNYELTITQSGKFSFRLLDESGNILATRFQFFDESSERDEALKTLISLLDEETIFLVEHLLLRPQQINDALLPICLPENCAFCGEEDPYSFRMSLIMPAWPERFRNLDFRKFFEERARLEAPAHIALKVCWISKEQMVEFQIAYKAWLELLALPPHQRDETELSIKHQALIDIFEQLRTVYPVAKIHECEESGDTNVVRLDNTILGSENIE